MRNRKEIEKENKFQDSAGDNVYRIQSILLETLLDIRDLLNKP